MPYVVHLQCGVLCNVNGCRWCTQGVQCTIPEDMSSVEIKYLAGWRWHWTSCAGRLRLRERGGRSVENRHISTKERFANGMAQNAYRHATPGPSTYTKVRDAVEHAQVAIPYECIQRSHMFDMFMLIAQKTGQTRADASLNTSNPRIAQHQEESKPTCFYSFICCYASVVCGHREFDCDSAMPNVALCASTGGRWGKPKHDMCACVCGRRHKVQHLLNLW